MRSFSRFVEDAYFEIKNRQTEVGRLSLVEFSDEEYNTLLSLAKEIIHSYRSWQSLKQKKARIVFLAFACEYVRRNKYTDDNKFWDDFFEELNVEQEYYHLITEELLWQTFEEEGIKQKLSSGLVRRLFVESLISEINVSEATHQDLLDFFIWYYRNDAAGEVTTELINLYNADNKKQLSLSEKVIAVLSKDCQILAQSITCAIEQNISLAQTDFESYSREIMARLGPNYDPTHIQLISRKKQLHDLILRLENHCTPSRFLSILERQPKVTVYTPNRDSLSSSAVLKAWKTRDFPYGLYWLDQVKYRVVPFPWTSLEDIAQWPYEQVIPLRRGGYLAYKNRDRFHVQIGKRTVEGRPCTFENERYYIWTDAIPYGEPLVIDRHLIRESAGIDWKISLYLGYDMDHQPLFEIVCDSLKVYFPDKPRGCITLRTSQSYEESVYLKSDGTLNFSRGSITFPLKNFVEPITIWLYLNEELLSCKELVPEPTYLFSHQTHERILTSAKREWGEKRYYLFTTSKNNITTQGIELELLDATFRHYFIYEITWQNEDDDSQPMQLQAGDLSWVFQRQCYFFIQVHPQTTAEFIQLARHQAQQFSSSTLSLVSNMDVINSPINCLVFYSDELIYETTAQQCLQLDPHHSNQYFFTQDFLQRINERTFGQQQYGHCRISFFEEGKLLGQTTLALIPALKMRLPDSGQLVLENEEIQIQAFSPFLSVWNPRESTLDSSAYITIRPKLTTQPAHQPELKGISYLTSQEVTAPLAFPTIGETVEIKLCPRAFGFRLYENKAGRYIQVNILDYYMLDTARLYVFTATNRKVSIYVENKEVFSQNADAQGNAIFSLTKIKSACQAERTEVSVVSGGLKSTFFILWTPFLQQMYVEENRASIIFNGPRSTGIILRVVDIRNQVYAEQTVICMGAVQEVICFLSVLKPDWERYYLILVYRLTDGTELPSAWQWRLTPHDHYEVSRSWLLAGVGVSTEEHLHLMYLGET